MEERLLERLPEIFSSKWGKEHKTDEELVEELYKQIGQLKVENDWLKKIAIAPVAEKRILVATCSTIPVFRQCDLVNLARSSFYYQPRRNDSYNEERFHSSLGNRPPADVYFGRKEN